MNRRTFLKGIAGLLVPAAAGVQVEPEAIKRFFALDQTHLERMPVKDVMRLRSYVDGEGWVNDSDLYVRTSIFDVRDFGAVCDGVTDDRHAFTKAMDAASAQGGGIVLGHCHYSGGPLTIESHHNGVVLSGAHVTLAPGSSLVYVDTNGKL